MSKKLFIVLLFLAFGVTQQVQSINLANKNYLIGGLVSTFLGWKLTQPRCSKNENGVEVCKRSLDQTSNFYKTISRALLVSGIISTGYGIFAK